jgi:serine acetyltransferase
VAIFLTLFSLLEGFKNIIRRIKIDKGARIGAGSVVIEAVKAKETVLGNPAKKL